MDRWKDRDREREREREEEGHGEYFDVVGARSALVELLFCQQNCAQSRIASIDVADSVFIRLITAMVVIVMTMMVLMMIINEDGDDVIMMKIKKTVMIRDAHSGWKADRHCCWDLSHP